MARIRYERAVSDAPAVVDVFGESFTPTVPVRGVRVRGPLLRAVRRDRCGRCQSQFYGRQDWMPKPPKPWRKLAERIRRSVQRADMDAEYDDTNPAGW